MRVYAPSEWGATMDYDSWDEPFTPDDGIALHHGGSSDYPAAQQPYSTAKEMTQLRSWERFHLSKGWRGLAYGWAVGQSGALYRIRGWNRYGAHLGDIDEDGIANNDEIVPIIWIASGTLHVMSPEAEAAIEWLRTNIIEPGSPDATWLYGHKEIQSKPTACPGAGGMDYVSMHRELEVIDMTPEECRQVVREELTLHFGPAWTANDNRRYVKAIVDSVWHAVSSGRKTIVTLDETRDAAVNTDSHFES